MVNNSLKHGDKSSTSIIFVPNLKEIKAQEDGFHEF